GYEEYVHFQRRQEGISQERDLNIGPRVVNSIAPADHQLAAAARAPRKAEARIEKVLGGETGIGVGLKPQSEIQCKIGTRAIPFLDKSAAPMLPGWDLDLRAERLQISHRQAQGVGLETVQRVVEPGGKA